LRAFLHTCTSAEYIIAERLNNSAFAHFLAKNAVKQRRRAALFWQHYGRKGAEHLDTPTPGRPLADGGGGRQLYSDKSFHLRLGRG